MNQQSACITAIAMAVATLCAHAQPSAPVPQTLRSAAERALETNPEVTARLNAFHAATGDVAVARGGYLPRVDLSADAGRTRSTVDNRVPRNATLNDQGVAVSVTQVLWSGLSTRNEVERLNHASKTRYFELMDAVEQTTLDVARAHFDVMRYRKLVTLAEDNYVQHRHAYTQIQSRVKAGVSRGVDLEQAAARLALAESNLTTENANLHDVTVRYLRLTGQMPPTTQEPLAPLQSSAVNSAQAASDLAASKSPAISAAVENLRSVRAQAEVRKAAYQPTVEARLRSGGGHNFDGAQDQTRNTAAELALNWNLFNGGADQARIRQSADLINQAADLRDKACRDTRQTAAIAYNDTIKLVDQIKALERNAMAIQKARDAYRQQFDIGQRSLLDLLNSENELYTARRSLTNAEHDLVIAQARSQAAAQTLTAGLGVKPTEPDNAPDLKNWRTDNEAAERCPVATDLPVPTPLTELDKRLSTQPAAPVVVPSVMVNPSAATAPLPATGGDATMPASAASSAVVTPQKLRPRKTQPTPAAPAASRPAN